MKKRLLVAFVAAAALLAPAGANGSTARLFSRPNSHINRLCRDHLGYIWLATDYGLTRLDGADEVTFTRTPEAGSLLSNSVLDVMEDSRKRLWVGTSDGIQYFNRQTLSFVTPRLSYPNVPDFTYVNSIIEDSRGDIWFTTSRSGAVCLHSDTVPPVCYMVTNSGIASNRTSTLFEDRAGNIWIGSMDAGVTMFNPVTKQMTAIRHNPADPFSLSGNMVMSIEQANDGRLLIATIDGGIDEYNYDTRRITRNVIDAGPNVTVLRNAPRENVLYIGTDGHGLKKYDMNTGLLSPVAVPVRDFNFSRSKIHDVLSDSLGNLWLGVYQKGALFVPSASSEAITGFSSNPFDPTIDIGTEPVLSVLRSPDGSLWLGTDGDGIYLAPSPGAPFRHLECGGGVTLCIFRDSRGRVWAGNYLDGLLRYDAASQRFVPVALPLPDGRGLVREINTIAEGSDGSLWIGTNGNGVCIYNPSTGASSFIVHDPAARSGRAQLPGNSIHSILFTPDSTAVWLGTSDAGLSRLDLKTGEFDNYDVSNMRLSNNCVFGLCFDRDDTLWVATRLGINRIIEGRTTLFNETNGLPDNLVYSIVPDRDGYIWSATAKGICRVDPRQGKFDSFVPMNALTCREFKRGSACRGADGRLYFGGVGGVVSFQPGKMHAERPLTWLGFDKLKVIPKGQDTIPASEAVIPLWESREVSLPYSRNSFTVSFGAVEFIHPENVRYSVMLEGHDNGWITLPDGVRSATWSSIPPGDYTLRVRAAIDGTRPLERTIRLTIAPPWYLTLPAKCLWALLALLLAGIIWQRVRRKIRRDREERSRHLREEATELKLQFFTDISHDIRTPLTMILTPLEGLRAKLRDRQSRHTIDVMRHNGIRILRMIDQIMDLRRFDNNRMVLKPEPTDIAGFIRELCESFRTVAETRGIDFSTEMAADVPATLNIDRDKIDKVLFNVLSNAFKFTPDNGTITLRVSVDEKDRNMLAVRISDTGCGIPAESLPVVFERFYQSSAGKSAGGTGIGLHLCRKMMNIHQGSIEVESTSAAGTTFLILVPMNMEAAPAEAEENNAGGAASPAAGKSPALSAATSVETLTTPADLPQAPLSPRAATILVVEDDASILDYLQASLASRYNVITAPDATQGLELALTRLPDLVLTDVMMEGMDGLELCRKIRAGATTASIPVVILTARVTDAQRNEGILAGADAYITKPFNEEHLHNQIAMLISRYRSLREKYTGSEPVSDTVQKVKSSDEKMLERVRKLVIDELANPELSVEYIAEKIGVSRSHLHRRLKAVANLNPSEYIKSERMRHAALLLTTKNMAVSEVAYATGFSSLSHFSTCFREHFGMSPSRYVALNKDKTQEE